MATTLTVTANNKSTLSVCWSNTANLKKWIANQRTRSSWLVQTSNSFFFSEYQRWLQWYWSHIERMLDNQINQNSHSQFIDIGSGIGIVDLFLALKYDQSKFTLIDRDTFNPINGKLFGSQHPFYNSWEPLIDAISTNHFEPARFNMQTPDQVWPTDVDVISSHFSWCWHYDVHSYLDQVYHSLKINGVLLVTFRFTDNENVVEILSNKFGPIQDVIYFQKDHQVSTEKQIFNIPGKYYGGLGIWKKIK